MPQPHKTLCLKRQIFSLNPHAKTERLECLKVKVGRFENTKSLVKVDYAFS